MNGRRSLIPSDLDEDQLALLAKIAPLITQPVLRARVADIAWFYGDRSNADLLDMAIIAYGQPLEERVWLHVGRDSWRRALALAKRRGKAGRQQIDEIGGTLLDRTLASQATDGFMAAELSSLQRSAIEVDIDVASSVAEHLRCLANDVASTNFRLARHLEREAGAWFRKVSDPASAQRCTVRIASAYVAEADERLDADPSAAMIAGHLLEKAIATLRELP
jgi:hypothetical protein